MLLKHDTSTFASLTYLRIIVQGIIFLISARLLGSLEYGIAIAIMSTTYFIGPLAGLNYEIYFLKESSLNKNHKNYFRNGLYLNLLTIPIIVIVFASFLYFSRHSQSIIVSVILLAISELVLLKGIEYIAIYFQSHGKPSITAFLRTNVSCCRLILLTLIILANIELTLEIWSLTIVSATAIALFTANLMLIKHINKNATSELKSPKSNSIRLTKLSKLSIACVCERADKDFDYVILHFIAKEEFLGAYAVSYKIIEILSVPFLSKITVSTTKLIKNFHENRRSIPFKSAVKYSCYIMPLTLIASFCLPHLLDYPSITTKITLLLSFLPSLLAIKSFIFLKLISNEQFLRIKVLFGSSTALNAIINITLIPILGWIAAIAATYLSFVFFLTLYFVFSYHE